MLKILLIGATSAIAHETAKLFAIDGAEFFLVGRSEDKLIVKRDDLLSRGAKRVEYHVMDMTDHAAQQALFDQAVETLDGLDVLFIGHGTLDDQKAMEADYARAMTEIDNNFLSVIPILTIAANYFEKQRRGVIAVISSVAGDRGRGMNYVYGAAMAAKTAFLSGLRNRLAKSNVHVMTIKPGRVATPMTSHLKKTATVAEPSKVGRDIYLAMQKRRDVVYTPGYWRVIMSVIRALPESIFKKLSL